MSAYIVIKYVDIIARIREYVEGLSKQF